MKKRTTPRRTKKVCSFSSVHHKAQIKKSSHAMSQKKISVCRHLSFPISLFPFRVVVKSNTLVLCSLHSTKISHSKRENDLLSSSSASFVTRRDNNNNNSNNAHFFVCSKIWKKTNTKNNNNNNIDNNIFKSNKKRFNRLGRTERPV